MTLPGEREFCGCVQFDAGPAVACEDIFAWFFTKVGHTIFFFCGELSEFSTRRLSSSLASGLSGGRSYVV
jgi:hypothetical protein